MNETPEQPTLTLGTLQIAASSQTKKRLFSRRPQATPLLVLTVAESRAEFDAREVAELAGGPILVEATTGHPAGDYFLVSASVVDPSSAVGASLRHQQFDQHSLLFMRGETILVALSAAQQTDLISWLEHTV